MILLGIVSSFLIVNATSDQDLIENVPRFLDLDLYMITVIMCDDEDQIDLLHRPAIDTLDDLKTKSTALLKGLEIDRYDPQNTQSLLSHIKYLREKKSFKAQRRILQFWDDNFLTPGEDTEGYVSDELDKEDILSKQLQNKELKQMISMLHDRWKMLYKVNVKKGQHSTLIPLSHPFIVPGGRFRELYYWDTWFVLEGLIASGLKETSVNMIKNFMELINTYGFIPNGTRTYYLNRSQPPFYCSMLESMLKFDDQKIKNLIVTEGLEMAVKELKFFEEKKMKTFVFKGKKVQMFYYFVETNYPRLESFREDVATSERALARFKPQDELKKQNEVFSSLKSGAESGIDFSSRWFSDGKNIETIDTIHQIPVDLNALMYKNLTVIARLYRERGEEQNAKFYEDKASQLAQTINDVLWNPETNCWNDFNLTDNAYVSDRFYPSNFYPLFFGINPPSGSPYEVINYYKKEIFENVGGIPASGDVGTQNTSQQWDLGNVWAPHNYLFQQYFSAVLKEDNMAFHVAKCFFNSVNGNYKASSLFYEKYTATTNGDFGGGGEYDTQDGFGWTNGAVLCFVKEYGDRLMDSFNHAESNQRIQKRMAEKLTSQLREGTVAGEESKKMEYKKQIESATPASRKKAVGN